MPRTLPRRPAGLLGWTLLASTVGCGDKALQEQQIAENARKVTAASTNDATTAIVDEGYRFRLEWPGEGWKLLGPQDAARMVPDAVAGASRDGVEFVVIVERVPGASVDDLLELMLDNPELTELQVESRTSLTFVEQDARRVVMTAVVGGVPVRLVSTAFVRADHCYQLTGWGPRDRFAVSDVEPVLRGFSLTPGEIVGPAPKASVDREGRGWRVTDGVFESAVSGLRVVPAAGWELRTGTQLAALNEDAEVGLESPALGAYVAILSEKVAAADAAGFVAGVRSQVAANLGTQATGEWAAHALGRSATFATFEAPPIELIFGAQAIDEQGYQVLAWYPAQTADAVRPALGQALGGVTVLDKATRLALRDRLLAVPDATSHVGPSLALRGGTFREFAAGVIWRSPPGFWRLLGGDRESTEDVVESLVFEDLEVGINGHLAIEERPEGDALAWHERRVAMRRGRPGRRAEIRLGGGMGYVTEVVDDGAGLGVSTSVATIIHGTYGVELLATVHAARMAGVQPHVQAVFSALELVDELPEISIVDGEHRDLRFGFAVRPPSGWSHTVETPSAVAAIGSIRLWQRDRAELRVFAFNFGGSPGDPQFAADRMEQSVREKLTVMLGPATADTAMLGGMTADHSTWTKGREHAEWYIARRNDTVFAVLAGNLDDDTLGDVIRSFRVLD